MNWEGCGRKRSWTNLRYYARHLPGETEKNVENLSQDNRYPDWDLNPEHSEYEARVLSSRPRRSVEGVVVVTTPWRNAQSWEANTRAANQEFPLSSTEPKVSLSCSQKLAVGTHPESDESSPHLHTIFKIYFNSRRILPSTSRSQKLVSSLQVFRLKCLMHFSSKLL
jgi:hypothetical protein